MGTLSGDWIGGGKVYCRRVADFQQSFPMEVALVQMGSTLLGSSHNPIGNEPVTEKALSGEVTADGQVIFTARFKSNDQMMHPKILLC